jgi:tRNA A37 threonylcarbamoyladenosine dehydratase
MTTYVSILSGPAQAIESAATAITHGVVAADEEAVFEYIETASSRAGVSVATARLQGHKVAIVGLGGTGAYILDLVAKTPVGEIHLYDRDVLLQHNAFRSPGAASVADRSSKFNKVDYYKDSYSPMRRQIVAHAIYVDASTVE